MEELERDVKEVIQSSIEIVDVNVLGSTEIFNSHMLEGAEIFNVDM